MRLVLDTRTTMRYFEFCKPEGSIPSRRRRQSGRRPGGAGVSRVWERPPADRPNDQSEGDSMTSARASTSTLPRRCFVCDVPLSQAVREGVEIDYCPRCRSIWLDRGETREARQPARRLVPRDRRRARDALVGRGRRPHRAEHAARRPLRRPVTMIAQPRPLALATEAEASRLRRLDAAMGVLPPV